MKYIAFPDMRQQWRWRFESDNGDKTFSPESYPNVGACLLAIKLRGGNVDEVEVEGEDPPSHRR